MTVLFANSKSDDGGVVPCEEVLFAGFEFPVISLGNLFIASVS